MIARYRNRTSLCVAGMAAPDWATGCRACFKYIAEKLDNDFSRKKAWTHEAQRGRDGQHITGCPMKELKARGEWSKVQERAAMQDILEEELSRRAAGAAAPLARVGLLHRTPRSLSSSSPGRSLEGEHLDGRMLNGGGVLLQAEHLDGQMLDGGGQEGEDDGGRELHGG